MNVFAESSIRALPEYQAIVDRFSSVEWIEDYQTFRRETMHREKQCLILARKRGAWLKPFHCYDQNQQYQFFSLDVAEGCGFDCVYCYLQSYLNHGALVTFVDHENIQPELLALKGQPLWISTGLLSDSLLAEAAFPSMRTISPMIPEGSVLELRSKSAELSCLEDPQIRRGPVVVSWSLNPPEIAQRYEYGTASLEQRLNAAGQAIALGYRIAFHLDPVFRFEGWKKSYEELCQRLYDFPAERIAFISLGLFRYMPELGTVIRKRFPYHEILSEEFFPAEDGKYHYFRAIRKEMYEAFYEWLRPWQERIPIFWSQVCRDDFSRLS
jgi:DNA repair photolyase